MKACPSCERVLLIPGVCPFCGADVQGDPAPSGPMLAPTYGPPSGWAPQPQPQPPEPLPDDVQPLPKPRSL